MQYPLRLSAFVFLFTVMLFAVLISTIGCGGTSSASGSQSTARPTINFVAQPATIASGASTVLTWNTSNAKSVSIGGIGTVSASGSLTVTPTATTTYDNLYGDGNWTGGNDCVFNGGDGNGLQSSAHGFVQCAAQQHCGGSVGNFELDYKQCDLREHRQGGIIWGEWIGDGYTERHNHLHGDGAGSGRDGYCVHQCYRDDDDRSSDVRARLFVNGGKSQLLQRNWLIVIYALPEQPGRAVRAGNSLLR
jgi:hypothetical protein